MKIKSVNIAAFGGLENKTVSFEDGFNVIYGENENGKTTVMNFIKMMFYGSGRGSSQIAKDARKKYSPWSGRQMAGSIDFELGGKNYRLEREFKSSNSTDRSVLLDLDMGTRQTVPPDIGVKLLGLSAAAFERSVFIGQAGAMEKDADADGEINSKLSNIAATGDESVSYEQVNARLQKAKTALKSKSGRVGGLDKTLKLIEKRAEDLRNAEEVWKNYAEFMAGADRLGSEIISGAKKAKALKEALEKEKDIKNAEKLREYLETKAELDKLNEELKLSDGGYADKLFADKLTFCIGRAERAESRLDDKKNEIRRLKETIDISSGTENGSAEKKAEALKNELIALEERRAETNSGLESCRRETADVENEEKTSQKKCKTALFPLLAGAAALVLSAALYSVTDSLAVPIAAAGAALIAAGFIIFISLKNKLKKLFLKADGIKSRQNDLKLKELELKQEISEREARLEAINAALGAGSAALEKQKALLEELRAQSAALENELEKELSTLCELYSRYAPPAAVNEIKASAEKIAEKAAKQKEIKQRLNYIARDIGNISYEEAREKLEKLPADTAAEADFEGLQKNFDNLQSEITEKKERLARAQERMRSQLRTAENPEDIKKELAELKKTAAEQEKFCRAADAAAEVLQASFAELRRGYGSALEKKAGEIFRGLTGGSYERMQISKSFDISVEKAGVFGGKEAAYLSAGTSDQAYLSLRLALSSLIFETSEELPLLLDDSLAQYDDARAEAALKYLSEFSAGKQAVMFTCHRSVLDSARQTGAVCKEL